MADQQAIEPPYRHHHLPPEPADAHPKMIHADDMKPSARHRRYAGITTGATPTTNPLRVLCCIVLALVVAAGITALVLYLVYRPSRPGFTITTAAVYDLSNATSLAPATAVAALLQFTLVIRNPNDRSAARYDRLLAYASYRGQPITPPTRMPPLVQDPDSTVAVSPVLGAGENAPMPVSADVATALATDEAYGVVALRVVVLGRVRFVSGPFRSGWYALYVRCDVLVGVRKGANAGQVPLLGNPDCDVDM